MGNIFSGVHCAVGCSKGCELREATLHPLWGHFKSPVPFAFFFRDVVALTRPSSRAHALSNATSALPNFSRKWPFEAPGLFLWGLSACVAELQNESKISVKKITP